ncbi:MAG: hypothetical protein ABJN42_31685 [Roseibium sp.]|uniref:hypothetical protein n=1 Tax=Roseibium sp. TaxID=1936156 RepID=UPI003299C110
MTWYHGTPEADPLRERGFVPRYDTRRVVRDIRALNEARAHATEPGISALEGHKRLKSIGDHFEDLSVPVPVFLCANRATAETYADDKRAFDFQNASPDVLEVEVSAEPALTIDAGFKSFRQIAWPQIELAMIYADMDPTPVRDILTDRFQVDLSGRIRVSEIGAALNLCGLDVVDFKNVVDTYNGVGQADTVRMVFDPSLLEIRQPNRLPEP